MPHVRRKTVSLRSEPQPDAEVLELIQAVEESFRWVTDPEDGEEYQELDADGMTLEEWAEWLQSLLPGYVHGYSPSIRPDAPTQAEPGSEQKIRVLRARVARGQAVDHPGDKRKKRLLGQGMTNGSDDDD